MSPFVTCSASAMFCDRTTVSGESGEPSSPVTEEPRPQLAARSSASSMTNTLVKKPSSLHTVAEH